MDRRTQLLRRLNIGSSVTLKDVSRKCLRNLYRYKAPKQEKRFPIRRSASVLVALFVGRMGDLYVLLSRRSQTLKSYAGDTSLPGGRCENNDGSHEATARREAFEEIGLPIDEARVPLLCVLEPFLSGNQLIVTPVVVIVTDPTIQPVINRPEVDSLFSQPLHSFLQRTPPFTKAAFEPSKALHEDLSTSYYSFTDVKWADDTRRIRLHRFLTGKEGEGVKPVFGLTASILIRVAQIGYARSPDFRVDAPDQPSLPERIEYAMRHHPVLRQAAREEGLHEWNEDEGDQHDMIIKGRL